MGARLTLGKFASVDISQELVDASLVGSRIGDAGAGILGVRLCWWNAEGCKCYRHRRRRAYSCPLHQLLPFLTPYGRVVDTTPDTVSHFGYGVALWDEGAIGRNLTG